jgi:SAM-dependent methyltransferase
MPDRTEAILVAALKTDLTAADFSVEALTRLWGDEADAALHRGHRVPALRALERRVPASPASTLACLFVLGLPVQRTELAVALPTLGVDGAERLGLVGAEEDILRPRLDLRPYSFIDAQGAGSWWIASDLGELMIGGALPEDHVLGVGGASMTLSGLMIGTPVESALDLGTGCGIQALHAARHAKRVVATDISRRAIDIASLNAQLNGITNIEFRLGSLFEPVAGERFDHIVSNPPFVITPRAEGVPAYEYRDGGMVGDALVASVIRGLAKHLEPGGIAQLLGNWEYRLGEDAFDRVGEWLDDTGLDDAGLDDAGPDDAGLDAWVIEREVQGAEQYAETWIRDGGTRPGPDFDRLQGAWLDDFESRGVTRVGFGYVTLRRPLPATHAQRRLERFRRFERLDGSLGNGSLGGHIDATLHAHDWQAALDDDGLADARLTVASDVTEERHYWPGDEDPTVMTLRQGGGFGRSYPLDTALAAVIGACDGELSIAAITAAIAQLLEVDESALRAEVLPSIRELVEVGVLLA